MDFNDIFAKSEEKVGKCVKQEEEKKEEKDAIKYAVFSFPFLKEKIAVVYVKAYWKEAKERFPQLVLFTSLEMQEILNACQNINKQEREELLKKVYFIKKEFGGYIIPKT